MGKTTYAGINRGDNPVEHRDVSLRGGDYCGVIWLITKQFIEDLVTEMVCCFHDGHRVLGCCGIGKGPRVRDALLGLGQRVREYQCADTDEGLWRAFNTWSGTHGRCLAGRG